MSIAITGNTFPVKYPAKFPISIEPVEAHSHMPAYYQVQMAGVQMVISDAHRRQIIDCLASAPPLPKPDAQIDAEREGSAYAPGQGDCEVLRG